MDKVYHLIKIIHKLEVAVIDYEKILHKNLKVLLADQIIISIKFVVKRT